MLKLIKVQDQVFELIFDLDEFELIGLLKFEQGALPMGRPPPEDWALRGLGFTSNYFPSGWMEAINLMLDQAVLETMMWI